MKKKIFIIVAIVLVTLTGCNKTLVDGDKKRVIDEKTGQSLSANILCLPEDEEILANYQKYEKYMDVKLGDLPKCSAMKVYDKKSYNGLWVQLFVRPLAWVIINLGKLLGNYGISVMVIGIIIRLIMMPFSAKTIKQQESLKKAQPELERIEKKYNINPMSSCLISFIQLPLFFAFLEAINRVPAIFENNFWKFQLGTTPLVGIKEGNYYYIILIVLIVLFTALSFKMTMSQTSTTTESGIQSKYMMIFMTVFIGIASIQLPSAIALYWVVTNAFNVFQTILFKKVG